MILYIFWGEKLKTCSMDAWKNGLITTQTIEKRQCDLLTCCRMSSRFAVNVIVCWSFSSSLAVIGCFLISAWNQHNTKVTMEHTNTSASNNVPTSKTQAPSSRTEQTSTFADFHHKSEQQCSVDCVGMSDVHMFTI